jgi:nucleotide-binding universal stress UspA family protein
LIAARPAPGISGKVRLHPGKIRATGGRRREYSGVAMKTILVPLDLSTASVQVCDAACEFASLTGGKLILLHVVQPPPVMMSEVYAFDSGRLTELVGTARKVAANRLRALARRCEKRGLPVRSVLRTGPAVRTILTQATVAKAGLIVMGTHGHGAVYDLLVGSTTHGVLKRAPCPVMVVPTTARRPPR